MGDKEEEDEDAVLLEPTFRDSIQRGMEATATGERERSHYRVAVGGV